METLDGPVGEELLEHDEQDERLRTMQAAENASSARCAHLIVAPPYQGAGHSSHFKKTAVNFAGLS